MDEILILSEFLQLSDDDTQAAIMATEPPSTPSEALPCMQELILSLSKIVATNCEGLPGVPDLEAIRFKIPLESASRQSSGLRCIKCILSHPDDAYRFCPGKHHAYAEERPSFRQLVSSWKHADPSSKKDYGSFPDVRSRKAQDCFTNCVLRCTCDSCSENPDEAVKIECEPYAFGKAGDMILVHKFPFDNDIWALVFGTWADPDEYRIWGAWDTDPSVTGYNAWVLLREVHPEESTGSRKRSRETLDDTIDRRSNPTRAAFSSRKKKRPSKQASLDHDCCDDWNIDCGEDDDDDEEIFKREIFETRSIREAPNIGASGPASNPTNFAVPQRRLTKTQNHGPRSRSAAAASNVMQTPGQRDVAEHYENSAEVVGALDRALGGISDNRCLSRKSNQSQKGQPRICAATLRDFNPTEVYCFISGDHNARAFGKQSFNQLIVDWNDAPQHTKDDYSSFPEVRGRGALVREAFKDCIVRCVCNECNQGSAVHLHCKPYQFGKRQIFVHEFDRHGKAFAFILGSWSEQEYRLWGAYDVELENGVGYHKLVHLEEVTPDDAEGVDVAKESPVTGNAHATTYGTSQNSYQPLQSQDAVDGSKSHRLTHQRSQASGTSRSQWPEQRSLQHDIESSKSASAAISTNTNRRSDTNTPAQRSTLSRLIPSAAETLQARISSLSEAYENAEAHVVDLQDSSGDLIMDSNEQLANHLKRLKMAADKDNEDMFGMMWRALNRDLTTAGLDRLPVQEACTT